MIDLYYDRSGNQYERVGRDWALEIKRYLEYDREGNKTGWKVNLMSRNQGNIEQQTEFLLAKGMMSNSYEELPDLLIDRYQCRQLISSMNVAKQIVKPDKKGVRKLYKDKSSEKLPLKKRPMYSTNMSDAFKYLICRRKWLSVIKDRKQEWGDPGGMDD